MSIPARLQCGTRHRPPLSSSKSPLLPTETLPPKQTAVPNRQHSNTQRILPANNLSSPLPPVYKEITLQRRDFAFLLSLGSLRIPSSPALAINLGISGPKDWLKEQKKKSAKYLLAPIEASREILRAAYLLLSKDSNYENEDLEEFHNLVKSAGRDCVPTERNSLVSFQAKTGVEVCTFKLVVNNASSLLDVKDSAKLEAEAMLNDLIRSFSILSDAINEADIQLVSDRQKAGDALMDVISSLDKFEKGIKNCLEA